MDALGVSDSVIDPEEALKAAFKNGMTVFALTNHNEVETAIALSQKHPGKVLIGEEVSVSMKRNRAFHLLVYFLMYSKEELVYTERDFERLRETHAKIQRLRHNFPKLAEFLSTQDVFCSMSHVQWPTALFK